MEARQVGLALGTLLLAGLGGVGAAHAAAAGPEVRVTSGFDVAALDRWTYLRFDARHVGGVGQVARITLTRESGVVESVERPVPADQPWSWVRYDYAGGPDRLASAKIEVGGAAAAWERPARIPPSRLLVIITADEGRALPVTTLIGARKGLGLGRVAGDALPDRWMAWRGVTAVLTWADELPARASAEGRALRGYIQAGGTLLLYAGDGGADLLPEWTDDSEDLAIGRGRVLRMGRGGHLRPPELTGAPPPPAEAPMLVAAPVDPPAGWLLARVGWFVPLVLLGLAMLRRRPSSGGLILAVTLVGAVVAPRPPSSAPASVREARWAAPDAGYVRQELSLTPGRTGPLTLPAGPGVSVVALDPSAAISLTLDDRGTIHTPARWGDPVELLVETLAVAD